jgi:hypothetical protein
MARLFSEYVYFFYGYLLMLIGTLLMSLTYVVRLEIVALRP